MQSNFWEYLCSFYMYFQNSRNILYIEMVNDNKSNQNKKEYKKEIIETLT